MPTDTEKQIIAILFLEREGLSFEQFCSLLSDYSLIDILNAFEYIECAMPKTTPERACAF